MAGFAKRTVVMINLNAKRRRRILIAPKLELKLD